MIFNSLKKEALIILSDVHSIGVLLILPVAFMLIMTFAMSGQSEDAIGKIKIKVTSTTPHLYVDAYKEYIQQQGFQITANDALADIIIALPDGFEEKLLTGLSAKSILLNIGTSIIPSMQPMVIQLVHAAFSKLRLHVYMLDVGDLDEKKPLTEQITEIDNSANVKQYFLINVIDLTIGN